MVQAEGRELIIRPWKTFFFFPLPFDWIILISVIKSQYWIVSLHMWLWWFQAGHRTLHSEAKGHRSTMSYSHTEPRQPPSFLPAPPQQKKTPNPAENSCQNCLTMKQCCTSGVHLLWQNCSWLRKEHKSKESEGRVKGAGGTTKNQPAKCSSCPCLSWFIIDEALLQLFWEKKSFWSLLIQRHLFLPPPPPFPPLCW